MYFTKFKRSGDNLEDLARDLVEVQEKIKFNAESRERLKNLPEAEKASLSFSLYTYLFQTKNPERYLSFNGTYLAEDAAIAEVKKMLDQDYEQLKEIETEIRKELKEIL